MRAGFHRQDKDTSWGRSFEGWYAWNVALQELGLILGNCVCGPDHFWRIAHVHYCVVIGEKVGGAGSESDQNRF